MIERVSYIADDGTAFEDEDECIDYERGLMLKKYEHDIHMWNCEFQPIPITDSQALDKVYYLTCDTAEAVEVMHNWFEYMGYSSPFEGVNTIIWITINGMKRMTLLKRRAE